MGWMEAGDWLLSPLKGSYLTKGVSLPDQLLNTFFLIFNKLLRRLQIWRRGQEKVYSCTHAEGRNEEGPSDHASCTFLQCGDVGFQHLFLRVHVSFLLLHLPKLPLVGLFQSGLFGRLVLHLAQVLLSHLTGGMWGEEQR